MSLNFDELWAKAKPVPGPSRPGPVKARRSPAARYTRKAEEEDIRGDHDIILERIDPVDQCLIGGLPTEAVIEAAEDGYAIDEMLRLVVMAWESRDDVDLDYSELPVTESMTQEAWALR